MKNRPEERAHPIKFLACSIFGHRPYKPNVFSENKFMEISDSQNSMIATISMCMRCKSVYWERV